MFIKLMYKNAINALKLNVCSFTVLISNLRIMSFKNVYWIGKKAEYIKNTSKIIPIPVN